MADASWQKVREIFDSALRVAPEERRRFVDEACGDWLNGYANYLVLDKLKSDPRWKDVARRMNWPASS